MQPSAQVQPADQIDGQNGDATDETNKPTQQNPSKHPKIHSDVRAKTTDGNWKEFTILLRAGTARGKYKDWFNVHDKQSDTSYSVDWRQHIQEWEEIQPEEALISTSQSPEIAEAKLAELNKWKEFDVYEEVANDEQKTISVRWVLTAKEGKTKARLVARGFEDHEINIRKDSPTCTKMNFRMMLTIAASRGWKINSLDIQSAYLQGTNIERDIFLKPPQEANTNKIWKLKKCVYGLNEAARMWYLRVSNELVSIDMTKSKYDEAIFFWHCRDKLQGVMSAHVDDFFWAGTDQFKTMVIQKLTKQFQISCENQETFRYLGINVKQQKNIH